MDSTRHIIFNGDSRSMHGVRSGTVDLVITSPPYPMIEMWDGLFSDLNMRIGGLISSGKGDAAFELMHSELDKVWRSSFSLLREGGIACIVVGDATRKIGGSFRLFQNHSRILSYCAALGMEPLPGIIWRKESNKPNKFMGSGMLPPSAYPTLEHEYVLLLRKGGNRLFVTSDEKERRRSSAYFWEERNRWFNDLWTDIKGERQSTAGDTVSRRNASFPVEIANRLVCMFSIQGDTVLDPFLGIGTTAVSAACCGRNSIGYEIEKSISDRAAKRLLSAGREGRPLAERRLREHRLYVEGCRSAGRELRYTNRRYGFPVTTSQETDIVLPLLSEITEKDGYFEAIYG